MKHPLMREDMTAQGRLDKASRQLAKLIALRPRIDQDPQARREFIDTAEDCLITLRSVPDHLFEEANQTYQLGVGLEERLYPSNFRKKATDNQANGIWNEIGPCQTSSNRFPTPLRSIPWMGIEQRHFLLRRDSPIRSSRTRRRVRGGPVQPALMRWTEGGLRQRPKLA